jgi:O-antigen/teichoic acid export membrane protein
MSTGIQRNIIANFVGRAWGVVAVYLFIPLYIKFLGIEAYGLVGFYSTLLGVLAFADMGFTATLNREMARYSVRKDSGGEMKDLLRTYESTYFCVSAVLAAMIWQLAPTIAEHWLRAKELPLDEMVAAIRLMGLAIVLQMLSGLYVGGLMGLQLQIRANCLQVTWGMFRGFGVLLVLWLWSPTILAFASWQLVANAAYCLFARHELWRTLSSAPAPLCLHFKWQVFRNTWRYAGGMAGMAIVSTLLVQTDKLVVSKLLPLEMLGYYTLAGALASVPIILANPIALAVFPRLTGLVAMKDHNGLKELYHQTCEWVAIAIVPAGLTIALFAGDLISAWTGSALIAERTGTATILLVLGQIMQAITVVPYYVVLAHGNSSLILTIFIASALVITPMLVLMVLNYGIVGAGASWLILNIVTLPPYMYFVHRRFLPGELWQWCLRDLGQPFIATLPVVLLGRWLVSHTDSRLSTFCLIGLVWGLSTGVSAFAIPRCRRDLRRQVSSNVRCVTHASWR